MLWELVEGSHWELSLICLESNRKGLWKARAVPLWELGKGERGGTFWENHPLGPVVNIATHCHPPIAKPFLPCSPPLYRLKELNTCFSSRLIARDAHVTQTWTLQVFWETPEKAFAFLKKLWVWLVSHLPSFYLECSWCLELWQPSCNNEGKAKRMYLLYQETIALHTEDYKFRGKGPMKIMQSIRRGPQSFEDLEKLFSSEVKWRKFLEDIRFVS